MSSAVYQFFKVKRITLDLLVETLWLPCADSALGFLVIIREICKQGPEMELTTVGITAMCDGGVASESFGSAVSLPFASSCSSASSTTSSWIFVFLFVECLAWGAVVSFSPYQDAVLGNRQP